MGSSKEHKSNKKRKPEEAERTLDDPSTSDPITKDQSRKKEKRKSSSKSTSDEPKEKKNKKDKKRRKDSEGKAKDVHKDESRDTEIAAPDGLQRFPDFSQDPSASTESILKAAQLGIPQWLAHPTTVERDVTVPISDGRFALSSQILSRCAKAGVESLFAVQSAVIPALRAAHALARLRQHVRDLCVSAPTGSGKTLAFVIPIVEKLRSRLVTRLRALVVLPTKDLAHQVKECFAFFCVGTSLRVGLAAGDVPMAKEQASLVSEEAGYLDGDSSLVDILVCTPGRLYDHLTMTKGFTLQHLEFWVMDEADRLLNEANEEWLSKVHTAIEQESLSGNSSNIYTPASSNASTMRRADLQLDPLVQPPPRIQKLLFSATLTGDPAKLARLKLVNPLYIAVTSDEDGDLSGPAAKYTFPSTLSEYFSICPEEKKPLWLMYMLWSRIVGRGICFTKSLETAHRLAQLMQAWTDGVPSDEWPEGRRIVIAEYSSEVSFTERTRLLRLFKEGNIDLLICSDLIARGLDIDQIETVVNYDAPTDMSQYTHRVGRTARAGKNGSAYTLVGVTQAHHFKTMMLDNGHWGPMLKRFDPRNKIMDALRDQYKVALEKVGSLYAE
ncbi:ATP-dependent RNA helicase dbp6 [Coemansia interrupta]|uniref:ATP-dependent RNA helicase n=1 Tax=Coemansia interrupta TaxID=1126814 RepID=A0A9W8HLK3_9FUNG|nr:ATP-dependent RNA helicase dbp6 [Coemansia interrupta]